MVHSLDKWIVTLLAPDACGYWEASLSANDLRVKAPPVCYAHPLSALCTWRLYWNTLPSSLPWLYLLNSLPLFIFSLELTLTSLACLYRVDQASVLLCRWSPSFITLIIACRLYIMSTVWTVPAAVINSWRQYHASFIHIEFPTPSRMPSAG